MSLGKYLKQVLSSIEGHTFKSLSYALNTRGKKLAWLVIFAVTLFLYWSSSRLMPAHRQLMGRAKQVADWLTRPFLDKLYGIHNMYQEEQTVMQCDDSIKVIDKRVPCLQRELERWTEMMDTANVAVYYPDHDSVEKQFLPFTGNGFVGVVVDGKSKHLYLVGPKDGSDSPIEIPMDVLVQVDPKVSSYSTDDAVVLNIKDGIIHFYRAYTKYGSCALLKHTVFAHRRHSGIIVQQLTMSNLMEEIVEFDLVAASNGQWKKSTREQLSLTPADNQESHVIFHGPIESQITSSKLYAAVAMTLFPPQVSVPVKSYKQVNVLTMVSSSNTPSVPSSPASTSDAKQQKLISDAIQSAKQGLKNVLGMTKPSMVLEEHVKAWNEVWELGLSVESNNDPDSPLPLHVNLTEYYTYSLSPFSANGSNDLKAGAKRKREMELQALTGSCFDGSPTMYSAELWVLPKDIGGLMTLQEKWTKILSAHGCSQMLNAGLFGWQEAIALSFSGLQFTDRGLELALNPLSLASNVSVRHLPCFKRQLFLRIVIDKSHDIQNVQLSSYGSPNSKLYACDAGCEHISELKTAVLIFAIRVTSPVTPILYVSPNKTKLELIKSSKFILMSKPEPKVEDIPSFAAHHFKLSPKFWLAVGVLIAGFHVVVIKMIYNECRKERGRRGKARPFVS